MLEFDFGHEKAAFLFLPCRGVKKRRCAVVILLFDTIPAYLPSGNIDYFVFF
jgi:hypothetical protein